MSDLSKTQNNHFQLKRIGKYTYYSCMWFYIEIRFDFNKKTHVRDMSLGMHTVWTIRVKYLGLVHEKILIYIIILIKKLCMCAGNYNIIYYSEFFYKYFLKRWKTFQVPVGIEALNKTILYMQFLNLYLCNAENWKSFRKFLYLFIKKNWKFEFLK